MKKLLAAVPLVGALALGAAVYAQAPGGGYGPGWGLGPGMMAGSSYGYPCGGPGMMGGPGYQAQAQLTEESAKTLVQQYTDKYLKGYTVERMLPFTARSGMTAYQAELKGPNDEMRTLHVNPWGNVMPFGGPGRRG